MVSAGRNERYWVAYVAAGIGIATAALVGVYQRPEVAPCQYANTNQGERNPDHPVAVARTANTVAEGEDHSGTKDGQAAEKACEQSHADPIRVTDWLTALSAFASALFALALAILTWRLWVVGRNQHRSMMRSNAVSRRAVRKSDEATSLARQTLIATQRPWLQIVDCGIKGSLEWDELGNGVVPCRFLLKNTGNSPAITVSFNVSKLIHLRGENTDIISLYRAYCDRCQRGLIAPQQGYIVFPDQTLDVPWKFTLDEDDFTKALANEASFRGVGKEVRIHMIVCVTYNTKLDSERRHTGGIYEIRRLVPGEPREEGGYPVEFGVTLPKGSAAFYQSELPVTAD